MDARGTIQLALIAIESALCAEDALDGDMPDDVYEGLQRARGAAMRWLRDNPPNTASSATAPGTSAVDAGLPEPARRLMPNGAAGNAEGDYL